MANTSTLPLCELETRPGCNGTMAFSQVWTQFRGYADPPWNLVGRVLVQVRCQKDCLVLVAPVWRSQSWYPLLLGMLIHIPLLLPSMPDLPHRLNQLAVISPISLLGYLRYRFRCQRISEQATKLLLASWRHKTA